MCSCFFSSFSYYVAMCGDGANDCGVSLQIIQCMFVIFNKFTLYGY